MKRAGYVLAGGASSRMGRDKALLPYRGEPLAVSVARAVAAAAGSVRLVGDPSRYGALGFPVIPDLYPGEGPLGGILTALDDSSAEWNAVAACDMPEIDAAFLDRLFEEAERVGAGALVPVGPSGRGEPLCAIYRRSARTAIQAAFDRGVRRAMEGLAPVAVLYPVEEAACFQNVNTPGDWTVYGAG